MSASLTNIKDLFPRILRFITEKWKFVVIGLVSMVVLTGIVSQLVLLNHNLTILHKLQQKRTGLVSELSYWENIAKEYKDYRDAYFRIASLQFQLGKIEAAKESLDMVIGLDPNFQNAQVLGARIEATSK